MTAIHVTSEIKALKKVLLHRPGNELLNLTPATLQELLFDDIPFLKAAQQEHDAFAETLRHQGVEVVYLENLAAEVLSMSEQIKQEFLKQYLDECNIKNERYREASYQYLNHFAGRELVLKTMEGVNLRDLQVKNDNNSLYDLTIDPDNMIIKPMPNLYFTRDSFAAIGSGISLNKMYSVTRSRETIYAEYIFRYHPEYKDTKQYYNRYNKFHIEGGDILNLSEKVIAIGISQRTEAAAIDLLAKEILLNDNNSIEKIIAFKIPKSRAFMHLDTVFTQADYDKFVIHPGIMEQVKIYEIKVVNSEIVTIQREENIRDILSECLGIDQVELIKCGGDNMIASEREQWNDGSNTLCVSPGVVVTYERNDITNRILKEHGLTVLPVPSGELSRGRGGPRCMSLPLRREE